MARDGCELAGWRCGLEGGDLQHSEKPEWRPLLEAVGERFTGNFMWMFWVELEDGSRLHAYKHYFTRAYLFLTEDGRAFQWAPCGRYAPQRLDWAIEHALCQWWISSGWEAEDVKAIREAVLSAQLSAAES
jgi:hypothetical protein